MLVIRREALLRWKNKTVRIAEGARAEPLSKREILLKKKTIQLMLICLAKN